MESHRFDALVRLMAAAGTRRGAIASALGLGATLWSFDGAVEAGRKKKHRRRKRRRRDRRRDRRDGRSIPLGGACGSGQPGACSGNATCLDGVCSPLPEAEACGNGPPCPPCQRCQNGHCTAWPNNTFDCNGRHLHSIGGGGCTTEASVGVCVDGSCECSSLGTYDAETNQCHCSQASAETCPNCCRVDQVCYSVFGPPFVTGTVDCVGCL